MGHDLESGDEEHGEQLPPPKPNASSVGACTDAAEPGTGRLAIATVGGEMQTTVDDLGTSSMDALRCEIEEPLISVPPSSSEWMLRISEAEGRPAPNETGTLKPALVDARPGSAWRLSSSRANMRTSQSQSCLANGRSSSEDGSCGSSVSLASSVLLMSMRTSFRQTGRGSMEPGSSRSSKFSSSERSSHECRFRVATLRPMWRTAFVWVRDSRSKGSERDRWGDSRTVSVESSRWNRSQMKIYSALCSHGYSPLCSFKQY